MDKSAVEFSFQMKGLMIGEISEVKELDDVNARSIMRKEVLVSKNGAVRLLEEFKPPVTNSFNKKAVVYHLFYPELTLEAIETVNEFDSSYDKIFTVSETLPEDHLELIKASSNARIFISQNSGRDIFPFWLLVKQGVLDQYSLLCKVHGKKSLHRVDGDEWRKLAISALCNNQKRINYIEDIFKEKPFLKFVAPRDKALLETLPRHWLGNLRWLKILSSRVGKERDIKDVSGFPIMAGSFYWMSSSALNKFRSLPIDINDWSDNHLEGDRIDGKLEHFIERCLMLSDDFEHCEEDTVAFIGQDGSLSKVELVKTVADADSVVKERNLRSSQLVNLNTEHSYRGDGGYFIGTYRVKMQAGKTIISGFLVNATYPGIRHELDIYVGGDLVETIAADREFDFPDIPGVGKSDFGFELVFDGTLSSHLISIHEKETRHKLSPDSEFKIADIESLLLLGQLQANSFAFPEAVRQMGNPYINYLENIGVVKSKTVSDYKAVIKGSVNKNAKIVQQTDFHVFVVNNPIAEIAVTRVIEKLKLKKEQVLIILHRVTSVNLLQDFNSITSNLPDVEILLSKEDLLAVFDFVNKVLSAITSETFEFYGHHYNALFTHCLGMHPRCAKVNLIEEGNLSSVPNWEAQHLCKQAQYLNLSLLANPETNQSITNSLAKALIGSEFDAFGYSILKRNFSNHVPDLDGVLGVFDSFFQSVSQVYSLPEFIYSLLFKRYYLWHPKMLLGSNSYSVSKAFHGVIGGRFIDKPCKKEHALMETYRQKLHEPFTLLLLPVTGRFGLLNSINKGNPEFSGMFSGLADGASIYYIMHPADRVSKEKRAAAKEKISALPLMEGVKAIDLTDVLGDNPVTEIAAACFEYVLHYGSSLSLVLQQYQSEAKELYFETFR